MIPKVIHMSWKDRSVVDSQSDLIVNGLKNLIELNPGWHVQISTDDEVDAYLKTAMQPSDYLLIQDEGIVAKTDIWRLFKLFYEGGVYLDIDRLCNKPLDDLLEDGIKWVLPTCEDVDFSHDFMMTEAGNPAYAATIQLYLNRRREGHKNIYFLGAQTYMHAVTHMLLGQAVNTNPGVEKFDEIRGKIKHLPFIKLVRESLPNKTAIYDGDIDQASWEVMKRKFYAENNVKHWTGEW